MVSGQIGGNIASTFLKAILLTVGVVGFIVWLVTYTLSEPGVIKSKVRLTPEIRYTEVDEKTGKVDSIFIYREPNK